MLDINLIRENPEKVKIDLPVSVPGEAPRVATVRRI